MKYELDPKIAFSPLKAASTFEDFDLHETALEWSLADPIIIENAEDIKSRVNWQDRLEPYHHQIENLMTFCRRLPVTLIADDVGLGKTISAGLILSELMIRNRVSRTLVICPSILGPQWIEELESKFGIFGRWVTGSDLDREIHGQCPVVATTYHSASSRLEWILPGSFDMLILDEAHKVRNLHGTQKSPKFAERIREVLNARLFRYVVMLTATPMQNRLWDLYSLIECLAVAKGHKNPFGYPEEFSWEYIADSKNTARILNPDAADKFRAILRQYLVRTRRADVRLLFPKRDVRLIRVSPNSLDSRLMRLVKDNIAGLNGLLQSSLATAMMSSPQALLAQLRNMDERNATWSLLASEVEALIEASPSSTKVLGLMNIVDELRSQQPDDWRVVIFTTRKETQRVICEALAAQNIPHGKIQGSQPKNNHKTVKQFTANPPIIHAIVSTDAGAEGVNLQAGNVVVNFDLPWNPMIVEQRIGRVQRLASRHEQVVIINLAVKDSPEERVVGRLMEKLQTVADTVGDIEAILEATAGDKDVSAKSFESEIRDLVIKSLKGQDIVRATELATKSIQEAKDLFETQREEMDRQLGNLNELHHSGPSMPRLASVSPSVPYNEFVSAALRAEGYHLTPGDHGCLRATKRGQADEVITFDESQWRQLAQPGVFQGQSPKLYAPGKPLFERLVQRWLDRSGHHTCDLTSNTRQRVEEMARSWLARIPDSTFESIEFVNTQTFLQGRSRLKVTASNAVDSYEKLLDVEQVPSGHKRVFENAFLAEHVISDDLRADAEAPEIKDASRETCARDSDIGGFCDFYTQRLNEEMCKVGEDGDSRQKLVGGSRPSRLVNWHSIRYLSDYNPVWNRHGKRVFGQPGNVSGDGSGVARTCRVGVLR